MDKLIEPNLVNVTVNEITESVLVWRSSSADLSHLSDEEFLHKFSVLIPGGFFKHSERITSKQKPAVCERYGGPGISVNGGGARTVNCHGYQLKGVGANPLVGRDAPVTYGYGGLDVQGAIMEIIYSELLNRISPVGAQKIYGLIQVDRDSAFYGGESTWSVILVREPCVRPAHFLTCPDFKIKKEYKDILASELSRMRSVYSHIKANTGISAFSLCLENFLDKSADQLSFCRMARFSHNVLTASNISMEGKLLDTSVCSFVQSGSNFCQISDFFGEPMLPLRFVEEIIYLVEKYMFVELPKSYYEEYYEKKFKQYMHINGGFVFALPRDICLRCAYNSTWVNMCEKIGAFILSGSGQKTFELPTIHKDDALNEVLASACYGLINNIPPNCGNARLDEFIELFLRNVSEIYGYFDEYYTSRSTYNKVLVIQVLKRAYLSSFFYITYVTQIAVDSVRSGFARNVNKAISEAAGVADWIFEELGKESVTLFKSNDFSLVYSEKDNVFVLFEDQQIKDSFQSSAELQMYIKNSREDFQIMNFDFRPFLNSLASLLNGDMTSTFKGVKYAYRT